MFPTQPEHAGALQISPLILATLEDTFLIFTLQMRRWDFREATHSGGRPEPGPRTLSLKSTGCLGHYGVAFRHEDSVT